MSPETVTKNRYRWLQRTLSATLLWRPLRVTLVENTVLWPQGCSGFCGSFLVAPTGTWPADQICVKFTKIRHKLLELYFNYTVRGQNITRTWAHPNNISSGKKNSELFYSLLTFKIWSALTKVRTSVRAWATLGHRLKGETSERDRCLVWFIQAQPKREANTNCSQTQWVLVITGKIRSNIKPTVHDEWTFELGRSINQVTLV